MNITFITPAPDLSGGQRVISIHADELVARGHHVTVVARGHEVVSRRRKLRNLVRGRILMAPARDTHFDRMKADLIVLPHSNPITAEDVPDADVVIATWWETAFEVMHLPKSKGRKFHFIQGHEVFSHLPKHISGASYFLPLKRIAISHWLVELMRDLYGDHDVSLVPNSVDHSLFYSEKRGRQDVPVVGLMYASAHAKGVDIALRAIEKAQREHPSLRVIAFGAEPPTRGLPLPKGAEFHLRPPQAFLRELYSRCDVFVAASRSGGAGLPIFEAMACRTPVVATLNHSAKSQIENGRNGFSVDVEDYDSLGTCISSVLSMSDDCWRSMSQAAYDKSLETSWESSTALFEKALL